jgi:hypothetical protein
MSLDTNIRGAQRVGFFFRSRKSEEEKAAAERLCLYSGESAFDDCKDRYAFHLRQCVEKTIEAFWRWTHYKCMTD